MRILSLTYSHTFVKNPSKSQISIHTGILCTVYNNKKGKEKRGKKGCFCMLLFLTYKLSFKCPTTSVTQCMHYITIFF